MAPNRITRRTFLRRGAGTVLLVGAAVPACGDDASDPIVDTGSDAGNDTNGDVTDASDTANDLASDVATDVADATDAAVDAPVVPSNVVKGPWTYVSGTSSVTLALEVSSGASVALFARKAGTDAWTELASELVTESVDFRWPTSDLLTTDYPDLPGEYTIHRAAIDALEAGAAYEWEVREGSATTATGTFNAPPTSAATFTMAWISDTMTPMSGEVAALLGEHEFDVFIHGGDIQYRTAIVDTWNGSFETFAPVYRRAPSHFTIGNHEFEATGESGDIDDAEYDATYRRLFAQQGDAGGRTEYYAFSWGHVRFIILNSEEQFFGVDGSQMTWLRAELEAVRNSDTLQFAVVGFHRPFWTMSNSRPNVSKREYLHPIFVEYGVPFVLTGHNHCFEHFRVDGVNYIVDGGGGALTYNPDDNFDSIEAERPGESLYRLNKSQTHGTSLLTFNADGSILYRRINISGVEEENFTVTPA
jgi:hypothetical protein